jgi:superfamily II DNA helicase RecQ
MSRKVHRVPYHLDAGGIRHLPHEEIVAILRGADDLISQGGRTLLSKLLKGSRDKRILELGLNENPSYGYYRELTLEAVQTRIDWVILNGYMKIEYDDRLPVLAYTEKGWEIERETYACELLQTLGDLARAESPPYNMSFLKDRNRSMILLLLDKIAETGNPIYIPVLEDWMAIEYKKVRTRIQEVIQHLEESKP